MAREVIMPALGMAQESGVLVKWLVAEGGKVTEGEPLMEVETDKAVVEVPAEASGTLAAVSCEEGASVAVGTVLAQILAPGEALAPGAAGRAKGTPPSGPASAAQAVSAGGAQVPVQGAGVGKPVAPFMGRPAGAPEAAARSGTALVAASERPAAEVQSAPEPSRAGAPSKVLASPKAKRLAAELGVVLEEVAGSGPGGAVRAPDVARHHGSQGHSAGLAPVVSALGLVAEPGSATPEGAFGVTTTVEGPSPAGWCQASVDLGPLERFLASVNSGSALSRYGSARPQSVQTADVLARALAGALARAEDPVIGALSGGPAAVSVFSREGTTAGVTLDASALRSVLDAALAREAGSGASGGGHGSVVVEDRSAQPFDQSAGALPPGVFARLTLGAATGGALGPVTGGARYAGLRLDYDSRRIDGRTAAAVFWHVSRVVEDPFALAVYG